MLFELSKIGTGYVSSLSREKTISSVGQIPRSSVCQESLTACSNWIRALCSQAYPSQHISLPPCCSATVAGSQHSSQGGLPRHSPHWYLKSGYSKTPFMCTESQGVQGLKCSYSTPFIGTFWLSHMSNGWLARSRAQHLWHLVKEALVLGWILGMSPH